MEHAGQKLIMVTTARAFAAAAGTTPSALAFGGEISPPTGKTD